MDESVKPADATWYGELYAIHKLKVAATRYVVAYWDNSLLSAAAQADKAELRAAREECHALGLTDEILLERLKV